MKYKAVLFDLDGVIIDSEPLHAAAYQTTLKNYGKKLSDEDYKKHFAGRTDQAGFERYFTFINESVDMPVIMDQKAKAYITLAMDQMVPFPGIVQLIKSLAENIPLALVTGSFTDEVDIALTSLGIKDCFTTIVTAGDVTHGKPHPEGYLMAAKSLGISPADCVVVEDTPSGVLAAKRAGIRCIAVTNTHQSNELQEATFIVDQLTISDF